MTYADVDEVIILLGSIYKAEAGEPGQITEERLLLAVRDADRNIQSQLQAEGLTPPLDTAEDIGDIQTGANLYVLSDLLDAAYQSTEGERNPESVTKEQQADKYIQRYINRPPVDEDDERTPRVRSFVAGNTSSVTETSDDFGDDEW